MEIIWMGILLAIGFYVAPFVVAFVVGGLALIGAGIASLFGGGK